MEQHEKKSKTDPDQVTTDQVTTDHVQACPIPCPGCLDSGILPMITPNLCLVCLAKSCNMMLRMFGYETLKYSN